MTSTDAVRGDGPPQTPRVVPRAALSTGATRATRQQAAVRDYLVTCPDFRTAHQVHDHLAVTSRRVSLPTVYRVLARLTEAGEVDVLRLASGQTAYRLCRSRQHHHHLICRRCQAAVEIAGESLERWIARTVRRHGFTAVDHDIELFGLCAACSTAGDSREST